MINEVAAGLLARARDDAAAVRAVIDVAGVTDAIVGFHAQQAVEKSVKAVLASREESFPFTHDLEGLLERCAETNVEVPAQLERSAGLLTPYAVRHRYGGEPPDLVDRQTALMLATLAVEWATAQFAS
ncbi:MAG TPA: HEPN domain-containing protein [Solirubrobacteraceae bacterium]|nr:HEPN domain-containing protein [Solirubrobacteraceae bacterium]